MLSNNNECELPPPPSSSSSSSGENGNVKQKNRRYEKEESTSLKRHRKAFKKEAKGRIYKRLETQRYKRTKWFLLQTS